MNNDNNIERILIEDNREKKRAGIGIFSRKATRKGRLNKLMMPIDFCSKEEQRKYKKAGKVVCYNMYDIQSLKELNKLEEIKNMSKDVGTLIIEMAKEKFTVKELRTHWNINQYAIYKLFNEYGVKMKPVIGGRVKTNEVKKEKLKNEKNNLDIISLNEIQKMEYNVARNIILDYRNKYPIKDLIKAWGTNDYAYYHELLPKYNIKKDKDVISTLKDMEDKNLMNEITVKENESLIPSIYSKQNQIVYDMKPVAYEDENTGFKIMLNGKYEAENLQARVNNMMMNLIKGSKYKIKISIEELEES